VGELYAELLEALRQPRPVSIPDAPRQDFRAGYDDAGARAQGVPVPDPQVGRFAGESGCVPELVIA
jgi:hypothetical protein